jgi:hypothetical protein
MQLIICADTLIITVGERYWMQLSSFNLFSIVYFPTALQNKSATAIESIFIDTFKFPNYVVPPLLACLIMMHSSLP